MLIQENTTIIIPIYNEAENIIILINSILLKYPKINIIVINDDSNDSNFEYFNIYKKNKKIIIINSKKRLWLNRSIKNWINYTKTKFFIVMDWDFQHPVKNIFNFLEIFHKSPTVKLVIWERKNLSILWRKSIISFIWIFLCKIRLLSNFYKDPLSWFFWWNTSFNYDILKNTIIDDFWYKILFNIIKRISIKETNIQSFSYFFQKRNKWKTKINLKVYLLFLYSILK